MNYFENVDFGYHMNLLQNYQSTYRHSDWSIEEFIVFSVSQGIELIELEVIFL